MDKYIGKETTQALHNFQISDYKLQKEFYRMLIEIKRAAAITRSKIDKSGQKKSAMIVKACDKLLNKYDAQLFLIDVFQTGSGTSSNMNVNEVIANLASTPKISIHPNDDVNWGQSSNDVIPATINLANALLIDQLIGACQTLIKAFDTIIQKHHHTYKLGRTHLQDAVPMTISMEFSSYKASLANFVIRITNVKQTLLSVPLGGTAIGTGINSHAKFGALITEELSKRLKIQVMPSTNKFKQISLREEQVMLMNELSLIASSLIKIANDLRLLSSGPHAGLNEISFKKMQAGSSIMPGKVNPVIMEMMIQVSALIIGYSTTVNIANQNGPLQLNMMMPLIAYISINSLHILTNAIATFAKLGINHLVFNKDIMERNIWQSSAIVTILNNHPQIGYDRAASLVQEAQTKNITILELIKNHQILSDQEMKEIFNLKSMVNYEK